MVNNEPYKEFIDELLGDLRKAKRRFVAEYDGSSVYMDLRWQTHLEGLFVDQLEKLSRKVSNDEITADVIGEYVMAFFISDLDNSEFNLEV